MYNDIKFYKDLGLNEQLLDKIVDYIIKLSRITQQDSVIKELIKNQILFYVTTEMGRCKSESD